MATMTIEVDRTLAALVADGEAEPREDGVQKNARQLENEEGQVGFSPQSGKRREAVVVFLWAVFHYENSLLYCVLLQVQYFLGEKI
ncbi:MAG: hypothetical protein ACEQSB_07050 [Undibacterium sp.]